MKKQLGTVICSLAWLLGAGASFALALPTANSQGDYPIPAQRQRGDRHQNWRVVDRDPKGLNCRMAQRFQGVSVDGIDAPPELSKRNLHNVSQWPVVFSFRQGQRLVAVTGNMDNQIVLVDSQGKPWLPVYTSKGNCFVRANSRFIQPIPENHTTGQPLE